MNDLYPAGYAAPRYEPHCGVLAVAIAAGATFEAAWETIRTASGRDGKWKGRTYLSERNDALTALGATYRQTYHATARMFRTRSRPMGGLPMGWLPRCTIATFAKQYAKPGATYLLTTGGHVVTLRDGIVIDQGSAGPVGQHRARRQMIQISTEILTTKGTAA